MVFDSRKAGTCGISTRSCTNRGLRGRSIGMKACLISDFVVLLRKLFVPGDSSGAIKQ